MLLKIKIVLFNLFMITLIVLCWIYSGDNFSNIMSTFCGLFSMFTGSAMIYDRELEWEERIKILEDKYNGDK